MFLEPAQRRCRSYDWRGNSGVYESWALHGHHGVLAQHPSAGSRGGAKMVVWCPVVAQSAAERSKAPGRVEGCESALSRPGPTWHAVAGTRSRIASWRRTDETSSAEGRQLSCRTEPCNQQPARLSQFTAPRLNGSTPCFYHTNTPRLTLGKRGRAEESGKREVEGACVIQGRRRVFSGCTVARKATLVQEDGNGVLAAEIHMYNCNWHESEWASISQTWDM